MEISGTKLVRSLTFAATVTCDLAFFFFLSFSFPGKRERKRRRGNKRKGEGVIAGYRYRYDRFRPDCQYPNWFSYT